LSAKLAETVKDLKQKNKEGGKALKVLLKRKQQLETQVKRMHILCEQMAKIQQKIVRVLERELDTWERRSQETISPAARKKVDSEIKKLKKRLETEKKLLRELYVEGKPRSRKRSKKMSLAGKKRRSQSKPYRNSRSVIKSSIIDDITETQSQATTQTNPPYLDKMLFNRQSKSYCSHCQTLNTVDYDFSNGGSFHVNCWQCGGLFHVPGDTFAKDTFSSPRSLPTVLNSQRENTNSFFTFDLPQLPNPPNHYNNEDVPEDSQTYKMVKVVGLSSMATELVTVICNIVFYGYEIQSQERDSDGALNVSLDKPITPKELSEIQAAMKALREKMQTKAHYNGDMDEVSIEGVRSDENEEEHRKKSENLKPSGELSKPTIGALTSPNLKILASQFHNGRKISNLSTKHQNMLERSHYI